jgi:hypothetical protein
MMIPDNFFRVFELRGKADVIAIIFSICDNLSTMIFSKKRNLRSLHSRSSPDH